MGDELARRVETVRRFNRLYTRQIGVLQEGLLDSPFSLAEARVIYELVQREEMTATHLARELDLEPGENDVLVRGEPHHSFGHDLIGETWELDLAP